MHRKSEHVFGYGATNTSELFVKRHNRRFCEGFCRREGLPGLEVRRLSVRLESTSALVLLVEVERVRLARVLTPDVLERKRLGAEGALLVRSYALDELGAALRFDAELHVQAVLGDHATGYGIGQHARGGSSQATSTWHNGRALSVHAGT